MSRPREILTVRLSEQNNPTNTPNIMIIIWRGFGFLVVVIAFVCALVGNLIANAVAGEGYFDRHKWPLGVSLLVAAALCWLLGDYLRKQPGRVVIDKQTGREFTLRKTHSLFFIPMHWWGPIFGGCALIAFVAEFIH
jgi:hypothetical protein